MVNHWLDFVGKEDSKEYRSKLDEGHANVCPFKKNWKSLEVELDFDEDPCSSPQWRLYSTETCSAISGWETQSCSAISKTRTC